MTERTYRTRVTHRLLMALFVGGVGVPSQPAFPGESPSAPPVQTQTGSGASAAPRAVEAPGVVPAGAPGMKIHIDPKTGALLREPAPGSVPLQLTPQLQNAFSTSHEGLVETPSSVPGGGVKVDLQGRFQSPLFVTIDANGKVKMQHLDETPESGARK